MQDSSFRSESSRVFVVVLTDLPDLEPTRKGMRRIRKRCVMDFKRSKSTKTGRPESEDDRKARIEGNGEAHEGSCTADAELCIQKNDMPGLDKDDESLIEEIYGFTADKIRQVQTDKLLTKFIDMRGSIAFDKNVTLEEGKRFFDMVTELYHQRRLRATRGAISESVNAGKQSEQEAESSGLEKAIEQEYRTLREFAHARRERARQSQALGSPNAEKFPKLSQLSYWQ